MNINAFLSEYSKNCILNTKFISQTEETISVKPKINATAGVYMTNGKIESKKSVMNFYSRTVTPEQTVAYSPVTGIKELRELWETRILKNNFIKAEISLPIVTSGITSALFIAGSLFVDKSALVFYPDMHWEAYDSIFKDHLKPLSYVSYNSYLSELPFENINNICDKSIKFVIVLNYPNNPTGWSPNNDEIKPLVDSINKIASTGRKVIVLLDDAYTGLFFESKTKSPFNYFYNLHENVLTVKCDGASKECLMWGQRIGFITFGIKSGTQKDYNFLESKVKAIIRGTYSSSCTASQNTLIQSNLLDTQEENNIKDALKQRYLKFKKVIQKLGPRDYIKPLPFNSGYFMCFEVKCNAELLRKKLLYENKIGIICYDFNHVRVAWSSVDYNDIERLIINIYEVAKELYENDSI